MDTSDKSSSAPSSDPVSTSSSTSSRAASLAGGSNPADPDGGAPAATSAASGFHSQASTLTPEQITARTFRYEKSRAPMSGVIETAVSTFLLLIAVRYYDASRLQKSLIASANSTGFLFAPFALYFTQRMHLTVSTAASRFLAFGALCFFCTALMPGVHLYVLGTVLAIGSASIVVPFYTQMYQDNYPTITRGRMYARTNSMRVTSAILCSSALGYFISGRIEAFQLLLFIFAAALAYASYCIYQCPTTVPRSSPEDRLFGGFRYVKIDRLFRQTLIGWMLMGFGNLMMLPLRVEYLANPNYGLTLSEAQIAVFVSVIPNIARLFMSPIWGSLFDRMNFFWLRAIVNSGFMLGILTFFFADSYVGLTLGAITFGISNAGGDVAWSLWVTKFAPPHRVADYMAVHTFLTGIRGMVAPIFAFHLTAHLPITQIALISGALIFLSNLVIISERGNDLGTRVQPT